MNNPECNSGKIKQKRTSTLKELNILRLLISKRVLQMSTYAQILYQIIFSTKECKRILLKNNREQLYKYKRLLKEFEIEFDEKYLL